MRNGEKYIDMNEYYLESQGDYCRLDNYEPKIRKIEPRFQNLNNAFIHLKTVIAKLTNDAYDLPTFFLAIELISSLTLMFTIEMEEVISNIPYKKDRDILRLIKEDIEKCCGEWPTISRKYTKYNRSKRTSSKNLKKCVVVLAAKVSYRLSQVMYYIKVISEHQGMRYDTILPCNLLPICN